MDVIMLKVNKQYSNFLIAFIPLSIISFMVLLTQSSLYPTHLENLSPAITLDLLITLPIAYFLLIRKRKIPKFTVVSVFVLGLVVATLILPKDQQSLLTTIKTYVIPVLEIFILLVVIFKSRKILIAFRMQKDNSIDFFTAMKLASSNVLPKPVDGILSTEIAVFYYLCGGGKRMSLGENEFTYHQKNGVKSVLFVFVFIILIETIAMHLFIDQWSSMTAWILTALSLYTCLQVLALIQSISKRPVVVDLNNKEIVLRYGFFHETTIPFTRIKDIELTRKSLPTDKSVTAFSPIGMLDSHNMIIHLHSSQVLHRLYGLKKSYTALAISIDEKERFVDLVNVNRD